MLFRGVQCLADLARNWSVDGLAESLPEGPALNVKVAPPSLAQTEFVHWCKSDPYYAEQPPYENLVVPFREFARVRESGGRKQTGRYYLQMPILQGVAGGDALSLPSPGMSLLASAAALREDLARLLGGIVEPLQRRGQLGRFEAISLWVSGAGAVSRCHYDDSANILVQCEGHKRVLLFPPELSAALAPFPLAHPLDRRSRLDLERPDYAAFPRAAELKGMGLEVLLGPGEALWVPYGWWHQVQSLDGNTTSLNIFLEDPRITSPARVQAPLLPGCLLAMAREAEALLAEQLGPPGPPTVARSCAEFAGLEGRAAVSVGGVGTDGPSSDALGIDTDELKRFRSYLLQRLLGVLDARQAAEVLALALDWRRFARLLAPPPGREQLFAEVRRLGHMDEAMWEYAIP